MPRHGDGGDITREQLESLKTKFQLLEGDRKAYFETYEKRCVQLCVPVCVCAECDVLTMLLLWLACPSCCLSYETTKRTNDQLFKELRDKNKKLRKSLAGASLAAPKSVAATGRASMHVGADHLRTCTELQREAGGGKGRDADTEVSRVGHELTEKRTHYDQLRHRVKSLTENLTRFRDKYKDLELEAKQVNDEDSPLTRKVHHNAKSQKPKANPMAPAQQLIIATMKTTMKHRFVCLRTVWTRR